MSLNCSPELLTSWSLLARNQLNKMCEIFKFVFSIYSPQKHSFSSILRTQKKDIFSDFYKMFVCCGMVFT